MKFVKFTFLLLVGICSFQFVNAQTIQLGNEDLCSTDFQLVWTGPGPTMVTNHTLPAGVVTLNVAAPFPGLLVTQATVTRTGQAPVTISYPAYPNGSLTFAPCCGSFGACDNVIEAQWGNALNQGLAAH